MLKFLKSFLIIISLYFVLHTIIVYGVFDGRYQEIVSVTKDVSWIVFCMIVAIKYRTQTLEYVSQTRKLLLILVVMALIGILITLNAHGFTVLALKNIIIGLKYGWYFMAVFYSAGLIGYVWLPATSYQLPVHGDTKKPVAGNGQLEAFLSFVIRLSRFILLGGLVIQGSKVLFPELRYALGFAPLNVYKAGIAPPLYYLTKQDGVMRYSGFFSGPNNFAFWLIGLSPLLRYAAGNLKSRIMKLRAKIGLLVFGVLNLGRVLLVGRVAEIIPSIANNKRIKNNKFLVGMGIGLIIGLFGYITYLKRESTTEHFALGIDAIHKFFARPWGYGLGASGPGIHRNGSLLPENYYLQLALDYGFLGPICFAAFWVTIFKLSAAGGTSREMSEDNAQDVGRYFAQSNLPLSSGKSPKIPQKENTGLRLYNRLFVTGFFGMLIAGGFLHVFEDSMVNYLFFVPRGVIFGCKLGITELGIMSSLTENLPNDKAPSS